MVCRSLLGTDLLRTVPSVESSASSLSETQDLLQILDLLAKRGLGGVQALRRTGEFSSSATATK
jgi:hypothetical protein